jgi:MFS family permease
LHYSALKSGLAILPMAALFLLGSIISPRIIARFGRGAMATAGLVQVAGLVSMIAVMTGTWPHTTMLELALPLAVNGACQSVLFTGLFRVVLRDVPAHHAGIGGGALITLQQSGLALGVATLGTLYLALEPQGASHAFAWAIGVQAALVTLVVAGTRMLPRFTS